ncbi:MAG: hypothetical protein Tsb009_03840 [Planctomycetaceae bacterium]
MTRMTQRGFLLGIALALGVSLWWEVDRFRSQGQPFSGVADWFLNMNWDSAPFLAWFLLLPLFWLMKSSLSRLSVFSDATCETWFGPSTKPGEHTDDRRARLRAIILALLVGVTSLGASWSVSRIVVVPHENLRFGEMPPAYHDEFSYLLQARMILDGRMSSASHSGMPMLFDQMHVVNEGRFASRYFPATGFWIAPFLSAGNPYWGHWLAGALAAMLIFAAGRELGGNGVGFSAGLLTALSPGMAFFSNLLLAHHPTMFGLSLFLFSFLRMMRTRHWFWAMIAGCGLTFAMMARPMTAAGFGLPFGIWFVVWLFRSSQSEVKSAWQFRMVRLMAMGGPILAGFATLMTFNNAITGDAFRTPYDVFTRTYTPRHMYGFNNVTRAEEQIAAGTALTKTTFENYDKWAKNLTPELAMTNVRNRWRASWQWTLGVVPLLMATCLFLMVPPDDIRWWLVPLAIVSLHLVHIPYWYDGIQHWHYVFESGPLWLLIFARATSLVHRCWNETNRRSLKVWWWGLVMVALSTAYVSESPCWNSSRVQTEAMQAGYSRYQYWKFQRIVEKQVREPRALVLIEHDPADRHIDYVNNQSGFTDEQPLLFGRYLPEKMNLRDIARAFPNRAIYLYRVKQRTFEKIADAGDR